MFTAQEAREKTFKAQELDTQRVRQILEDNVWATIERDITNGTFYSRVDLGRINTDNLEYLKALLTKQGYAIKEEVDGLNIIFLIYWDQEKTTKKK